MPADVNGSGFHVLLTEEDWFTREGALGTLPAVSGDPQPDLEWTHSCGLRLRRTVPFDRVESPPRLTPDDRRGADRDVDGVVWHVGDDRTSLWRTRDGSDAERFWPPDAKEPVDVFHDCVPPQDEPARLGAVVATDDRWLVVGLLGTTFSPPGLMLLDLVAGGEPVTRDWSGLVPDFKPIEGCRRPGGGLLVLDAEPGRDEPTRVWPLDRRADPARLEEVPASPSVFSVCDAGGTPAADDVEPLAAARPRAWVLPVENATAIAAVDADSYVVLDVEDGRVLRFAGETLVGTLDLSTALEGRLTDPGNDPAVRGHDIVVARTPEGRSVLFVSDAGGDEVFTFDIDDDFAPLAEHYPMRRHHGRGLVGDGESVRFDTRRRWHLLVARGRSEYRGFGSFVSAAFDGHEQGCRWHRVLLDGRLPSSTSVRVETRAADDLAALAGMPWRLEPAPYHRRGGTELSLDVATGPASATDLGTWETLVQRSDGRYCQLRLTLESAGGSTPELSALRLVFPRFSYLHRYLPQLYADEDAPTRFLERYLANPEGLLTDLETRIADVDLLFGATSAPAAYLDWLASWFGSVLDADLDVRRRRLFLEHAARIFATRGTPGGLVTMLRLVLDECPEAAFDGSPAPAFTVRIAERFLSRGMSVQSGLLSNPQDLGAVGVGVDDTVTVARWTPSLGANELHQRFRGDLTARYGADWSSAAPAGVPTWLRGASNVSVSPTTPTDAGERADWTRFLAGELGMRSPAFDATQHAGLWRRFLLQRYERPARLAQAHQLAAVPDNFDDVQPPERLALFGPALEDWAALVTLVVPIAEAAHRFSVLLPVDPEAPEREQLRMLDVARRVVELEKPAHTSVDVRPYWAAFQLGEARLGVDTLLGAGARRSALILNRSRLAQAGLAGPAGHDDGCGCTGSGGRSGEAPYAGAWSTAEPCGCGGTP